MEVNSYSASIYCCSITFTAAQLHRQSGVTDVTARELVLEINNHLLFNVTEVQNLVSSSALATLVHFSATQFLLFGNVHARFLFISLHAVPVQLLIVLLINKILILHMSAESPYEKSVDSRSGNP